MRTVYRKVVVKCKYDECLKISLHIIFFLIKV